jgi:hypothetical protein
VVPSHPNRRQKNTFPKTFLICNFFEQIADHFTSERKLFKALLDAENTNNLKESEITI